MVSASKISTGWALLALCATGASASSAETSGSNGELQVVTVTVQKRAEPAQQVPVTVAVADRATLDHNGIKDLVQAANLIPGLIFSRAPDDGLALTFRGLGTVARSQAFELSEAMFVDGIFMGKGRLYTTSLFDLDRVEFIQGSQSTLLGKNASLGAVSVVTRQPGSVPAVEGRVAYQFEHGGGYTTDLAGDLPVGDRTAVRLSAHYNDLDGWVHNDRTDHWGPEQKDSGVRAALHTQLSDDLSVTASYQYADNKRVGASYQLVGNLPAVYGEGLLNDHTDQFTAATSNGDTFHDTQSSIANLKGELDVGALTLVSQSAFVRYNLKFVDDFDFSSDNAINFLRDEHYRQFTQELRAQSSAGQTFEYMAGLFFLDSRWESTEFQQWMVPSFPPPPAPTSGQLFDGPFTNRFVQNSRSLSGFASGTWHLTSRWRVAGGIRVTRDSKDVMFGRASSAPTTVWNSIANPPFDPTPLSLRSNFLDGNASFQYDVSRNVMAYASFGHGSKAGGFAETNTIAVPPNLLLNGKVPASLVAAGASVKDEFAKNYEIGVKTNLLDRRLLLNIAAFWTDVRNFQDTVFTGGSLGFITFNGPARTRGLELQSAFNVTRGLRVNGGVTYAEATGIIQPIDPATSAPQVDAGGSPVFARFVRSQAPKVILNADTTYTMPVSESIRMQFEVGLRHRSMMFNQRQELFPSQALTTVDLTTRIEAADARWGVELAVRNAFNRISEDFASPSVDPRFGAFYGAYLAGPTPTRTILLAISARH